MRVSGEYVNKEAQAFCLLEVTSTLYRHLRMVHLFTYTCAGDDHRGGDTAIISMEFLPRPGWGAGSFGVVKMMEDGRGLEVGSGK